MKNEIQLKEVTVYQNAALFKMVGQYHCNSGINEIMMDHITRRMDKDSVRVKGHGTGKIVNIIIEKIHSDELIKEKIKKFTKERDDLIKKRTELEDTLADTQNFKTKSMLAHEKFAQEFPKWFSYGKIDIESVKNMNKLFQDQIKEISGNMRSIIENQSEVQKQIDKLNNTIYELGGNNETEVESYYKVIAVIDAEKEADFTIELSFMVQDAYWTPFYDIMINEKTVDVNLMANIHNHTEIDWKDIILNISTASSEPIKLEKPLPYNINHHVPITPSSAPMTGGFRGTDNNFINGRIDTVAQYNVYSEEIDKITELVSEDEPKLEVVDSSMVSNYGVQVYNLKSKFTIDSDKNPKPVHTFKDTLPSILQYFWTTTSPNRVLCNNKIKNKDRLILPGPAKIYINDEYIGETVLDLIAPNQEFKLGERITYDIKIKKIMKEKNAQKEGVLKGKKSVSYKFDIEIENLNGAKEQLILYERLPHSISERIKVKAGNFSDKYVRNVMNVLKFVIDMDKVKEKKIISYDYEVIYDKDVQVFPALP